MTLRTRVRAAATLGVAAVVSFALPVVAGGAPDVVDLSPTGRHAAVRERVIDAVVPGDHGSFTVHFRNAGPSAGYLVAEVGVHLAGGAGRPFYGELTLAGGDLPTTSVRTLAQAVRTRYETVVLDPGETLPVTLSYDFPLEATGGNSARDGGGRATVLLHARIQETAPPGTDPGRSPGNRGHGGRLPFTGATAAQALAVGAVVAVVGVTLVGVARRRRREEEETRQSMQLTQPSTSVPSSASCRNRM